MDSKMKDRLKRGLLRSAKSPSRSSKSSSMNTKSLPTQISLSTLETMETVSPRPEERLTKSCTDVSTTKADSLTFPPNSPDFMPRRTDSNVQEISDVKKLINIQNSEVRHDDNLHDLRKDSDRLNKEGGLRQDPVIASVSTLPVLPKKKNRIKETITRFFAGMTMVSASWRKLHLFSAHIDFSCISLSKLGLVEHLLCHYVQRPYLHLRIGGIVTSFAIPRTSQSALQHLLPYN